MLSDQCCSFNLWLKVDLNEQELHMALGYQGFGAKGGSGETLAGGLLSL